MESVSLLGVDFILVLECELITAEVDVYGMQLEFFSFFLLVFRDELIFSILSASTYFIEKFKIISEIQ
jgi:hypothetical protein